MDFTNLNPAVRSAAVISKLGKNAECRAYDSRLIYVFSGDVSATVGGKKLGHLGSGELLYIPAGITYRLKGQYLEAAVITFDVTAENPEPLSRIEPSVPEEFDESRCHYATLEPFDRVMRLSEMESEADGLELICNLFISGEGAFRARASALLKSVLLRLAESVDENALPARMVESLDNYIRENYAEDISNTELGAIFGYHPFYISKVLKDKKGITLKQYIIKYKLGAARAMLENTPKTINEIAEETGFTDASYFTKTFKSAFGETPKEYRNRFKDGFV
ncbi:MAG: helix-turn-helix domain-containing protein [Clostridia bacterium]|nr:helix-turn-helix domain-containing protein [Clostridia bacterium]